MSKSVNIHVYSVYRRSSVLKINLMANCLLLNNAGLVCVMSILNYSKTSVIIDIRCIIKANLNPNCASVFVLYCIVSWYSCSA